MNVDELVDTMIWELKHVRRHEWTTWDSFAGRTVDHRESEEQMQRRVIRKLLDRFLEQPVCEMQSGVV